jgi:hypothetical protein
MEYDHQALEQKTQELRELATAALPTSAVGDSEAVDRVMESFVTMTPPEKPEVLLEWITMGGFWSRRRT